MAKKNKKRAAAKRAAKAKAAAKAAARKKLHASRAKKDKKRAAARKKLRASRAKKDKKRAAARKKLHASRAAKDKKRAAATKKLRASRVAKDKAKKAKAAKAKKSAAGKKAGGKKASGGKPLAAKTAASKSKVKAKPGGKVAKTLAKRAAGGSKKAQARLDKINAKGGGKGKGGAGGNASDPDSVDDVKLGKKFKKTKRQEKQLSQLAGDIAGDDLSRGIALGDRLAPDVVDGEFLDRLDPRVRGDDVDNTLANFASSREEAGQRSPELQHALDSLKRRSEEGFSLQEREAQTLQARQSTSQSLQSGLRAAQAFNTGNNIQGGFAAQAFNPAIVSAIQARRGLENDLFLAETAEKARALTEFGGLTERSDQSRATNLLNIDTASGNLINADQVLQTDVGKFNAQQRAKEIAARTAKNATGLGIITDEKDSIRADQASKAAIKASKTNLDELLSIAG